jgi:hypothetical protein
VDDPDGKVVRRGSCKFNELSDIPPIYLRIYLQLGCHAPTLEKATGVPPNASNAIDRRATGLRRSID